MRGGEPREGIGLDMTIRVTNWLHCRLAARGPGQGVVRGGRLLAAFQGGGVCWGCCARSFTVGLPSLPVV